MTDCDNIEKQLFDKSRQLLEQSLDYALTHANQNVLVVKEVIRSRTGTRVKYGPVVDLSDIRELMRQYWLLLQSQANSPQLQNVEVTFRKPVAEMTNDELMTEIKKHCN